jgi:hypothetical protein
MFQAKYLCLEGGLIGVQKKKKKKVGGLMIICNIYEIL